MVASLRTAERNAKLVSCLPAIREAAKAVIPAAEAAVAALAALTAAKQAMMDAGFEHEASRVVIPSGPITDQSAIHGARPVVRLNPLYYNIEEQISRALDDLERAALNQAPPPVMPDPARDAAVAEGHKRHKAGILTPALQIELRAERERAVLAAKNLKNAKPAKGDAPVVWQPHREDSTTFAARTAA